ncbi:hypothetical protein SYK_06920 [Pseudodesulfovibrio nedwellii]|uniref:Uncharacterized protein n=1 Tax=Pseudodesulfovibrio nedwellii TaxID=2973072 RepID=A0ABM8AXU4_9BACT|nr:hypothetical protein [Pseudodesulfovibrio nedwellii]BDQ36332.1 hypothetical protein SYK_06920 [Pseudodesulfovibrio nedwellii]
MESTYNSTPLKLLDEAAEEGNYASFLSPKNKDTYTSAKVLIPKIFSLIDAPKDAVRTFLTLAQRVKNWKVRRIHYDYKKCTSYDLAAQCVLDYIVEEYQREISSKRNHFTTTVVPPQDEGHLRLLKTVGILSRTDEDKQTVHRRIEMFKQSSSQIEEQISIGSASYVERVAKAFVKHIQNCLNRADRTLTESAEGLISEYVGEVLDNIKEHTKINKWRITGFLDWRQDIPMCEVAIFNFGRSFADSFIEAPKTSKSYDDLSDFLNKYEQMNGKIRDRDERCLITLFALQEGISSKNTDDSSKRGMGTVDLIELFQRMHEECRIGQSNSDAKMTLLSGDVNILFDGTYQMKKMPPAGKIISFNKSGHLLDKFNPKFITCIEPLYFPGTVVSIRFPLERAWTEKI